MQSESGGFPTIGPPPLEPAISPSVHLSLTVAYITLYGFLFIFIYIQLWLILFYKHKRFSYQTVFLGLCLLWAGLRTSLFSFYFNNCVLANNLGTVFYWLLYCFPVCLQFITLCLLVLFFAQVCCLYSSLETIPSVSSIMNACNILHKIVLLMTML